MFTAGLALAIGLCGIACTKDDINKDEKSLQGGWQVTSWVANGVKQSDETNKYVRWTFKGNECTNTKAYCINHVPQGQGGTNNDAYKILREKGANVIEFTTTKVNGAPVPEDERETVRFIYSLEGDTLRVAAMTKGDGIPTKFESGAGSRVLVIILKRIK